MSSDEPVRSRAWAWLGIRTVEVGDGTSRVQMTATEDMANTAGFVHGGMISTLADSAMGRAVHTLQPPIVRAMSFDLKLSFISAARIGETLTAAGRVIHSGRRTAVAECRVEGASGRLVATASASFAIKRGESKAELDGGTDAD